MSDRKQIRIQLLGNFLIERGEDRLQLGDWKRRKAAALLQRVALEGQLLKDQAIDFLWPDSGPEAGANNLYRTLHSLRKTLDEGLGEGASGETIEYQDRVISLQDDVWVDVTAFQEAAQEREPAELKRAFDLYAGELLPNARYEEWTRPHRKSLRQTYRETALALAEHYAATGSHTASIDLLKPLLMQDPADEVVHRELMRSYANAGRRHDALRQYQTCVEQLREEMGVDPSPPTRDLYQQILEGRFPSAEAEPRNEQAPATVPGAQFLSLPPTVGREEELARLVEALEAAADGRGSTRFVEGHAGIGKTHLAREVLRHAEDRGFRVFMGSAHEQEGQLPYQPFVEAFDRWLAKTEGTLDHPLSSTKLTTESQSHKDALALYRSVAGFLTKTGEERPFALLVDDLHEADEGTLQLFHYLARQMPGWRGLLLATFRTGGVVAGSSFAALLNSLYRERIGLRIKLSPMDRGGMAQIIQNELSGTPSDDLIDAIHGISEGNPFFAQEIALALQARGSLIEQADGVTVREGAFPSHIPSELVSLLRSRVSGLGEEVEEALTGAAVLGRDFHFKPLGAVVELSEMELLDALDDALESSLVQEKESGYCFRHGLIRQALYDSLSRARRRLLHRRAGEALEAMRAEDEESGLPLVEALAHHYERSDYREPAIDYLIQAGRKAARMYAFELAVEYFERALSLMDELEVVDPEKRFDLLVSIEGYHGLLADTPRAVEAGQRALEVQGPDWEPSPEMRALVRRRSAIRLITSGRLEEAETALQAALDDLEGKRESAEHARVLYNLAQLRWHQNEYSEAFEIAERSLGIAERLEDRDAIARAFEMLALACHSLGEWQRGMAFEQQRESLTGPDLDVDSAFDVHL